MTGVTPLSSMDQEGIFREHTVPVDQFQPNPWGLYQVHGNVWEWTGSCYNENDENYVNYDGAARYAGKGDLAAVRGGAWNIAPDLVRSASRVWLPPTTRLYGLLGFRLARSL